MTRLLLWPDVWPDGGFWNQPLGFYVVGIPLLCLCVAFGVVIVVVSVAIILGVLGVVLEAIMDAVAYFARKEE